MGSPLGRYDENTPLILNEVKENTIELSIRQRKNKKQIASDETDEKIRIATCIKCDYRSCRTEVTNNQGKAFFRWPYATDISIEYPGYNKIDVGENHNGTFGIYMCVKKKKIYLEAEDHEHFPEPA